MNNLLAKYLVWSPVLLSRGQNIWPLMKRFGETQYRRREEAEEEEFASFRRVFDYAYTSIPFYRQKYQAAGVSPDQIRTRGDVARVPVLSKKEIMDHLGETAAAYRGRKFKRSTSGSTGKPLVFYKDNESMTYMDAILYRNYSWYGIDLGDRQARVWGHPLGRAGRLKTMAVDTLLNRIRLSAFDLQEEKYLRYLRRMEQFKAQYVYGYAQAVFEFCNYFRKRGIDLSHLGIKAIILTGEMVFAYQIETIREVFGAPVAQEYGCTEVGIIGFGCPEGTTHLMENLMVEVLPSTAGEGGDLVVSELYGRLFPFIRYVLGDRGRISSRSCSCGRQLKVLEELLGRKDDFVICPDGRMLDPYVVEYAINELPKKLGQVQQFKVVQRELQSLEIVVTAEGNSDGIRDHLHDKMKKLLPASMQVRVEIVGELPKELSGKLRCFTSYLKSSEGH